MYGQLRRRSGPWMAMSKDYANSYLPMPCFLTSNACSNPTPIVVVVIPICRHISMASLDECLRQRPDDVEQEVGPGVKDFRLGCHFNAVVVECKPLGVTGVSGVIPT